MYRGVIIGEDKREQIKDTNENEWKVHGQLTVEFSNKTYRGTGTLVSPLYVLTAGHNVYDPKAKEWAQNVTFHAGRNSNVSLYKPIKSTVNRVFYNWETEGKEVSILVLSEPV